MPFVEVTTGGHDFSVNLRTSKAGNIFECRCGTELSTRFPSRLRISWPRFISLSKTHADLSPIDTGDSEFDKEFTVFCESKAFIDLLFGKGLQEVLTKIVAGQNMRLNLYAIRNNITLQLKYYRIDTASDIGKLLADASQLAAIFTA